MKKLILLFGLVVLLGAGCAQKEVWTALYYPNGCKGCVDETIVSLELDSLGACEDWLATVVAEDASDKALFECGMNCVAAGEGKLSCAGYEEVDLESEETVELEEVETEEEVEEPEQIEEEEEVIEEESEEEEETKEEAPPPREKLSLEECDALLPDKFDSEEYKLDCVSDNTDQDINLDALPDKITIQPFKFTGTVDGTAQKIVVYWKNGDKTDKYQLEKFTEGDRTFWYAISERWRNFASGTNSYTFVAYFEDGTVIRQAEIKY